MSVSAIVRDLKEEQSDYEFYPTTAPMLAAIRVDIIKQLGSAHDNDTYPSCSVLDIGAGTGSALNGITKGSKYAIEKSQRLIKEMPKDVFIVGTDFEQNTLIDKSARVIFSNPPYSNFVAWTEKIITEGNAELIYLVIPQRWSKSDVINAALQARKAEAEIIYSGDFLDGERKARSFVDIVKINLKAGRRERYHYHDDNDMNVDPFELWFNNHFKISARETKQAEFERRANMSNRIKEKMEQHHELIKSEGLVKTLEQLYHHEMEHLMQTYLMLNNVDGELLKELNVSVDNLKKGLKNKISSLKCIYWRELFDHIDVILNKLTTSSRQNLLDKLFEQTSVDFNAENAHGILLWAIKHANSYFDDQLIELFDLMTAQANITLYKSNERTFGKDEWRYCRKPDGLDRYKLDLRIVVGRVGGIKVDTWGRTPACGLETRCLNFIKDIITVASNLHYDTLITEQPDSLEWVPNRKHEFYYHNHSTGKPELLFDARAFKNGNVHIRFSQSLICDINIENGRLRGWVKNGYEAAEEMGISPKIALASFASNIQITDKSVPLLL